MGFPTVVGDGWHYGTTASPPSVAPSSALNSQFPQPLLREGYVLVAHVIAAALTAPVISAPVGSGWEQVFQESEDGGVAVTLAVFYRVLTDSEPGTYTFEFTESSSGNPARMRFYLWADVDELDPIPVVSASVKNVGGGGPLTLPGATTPQDFCSVVYTAAAGGQRQPSTPSGVLWPGAWWYMDETDADPADPRWTEFDTGDRDEDHVSNRAWSAGDWFKPVFDEGASGTLSVGPIDDVNVESRVGVCYVVVGRAEPNKPQVDLVSDMVVSDTLAGVEISSSGLSEGDIVLAHVACLHEESSVTSISAPSGWEELGQSGHGGSTVPVRIRAAVFLRVIEASEPASHLFEHSHQSADFPMVGRLLRLTNLNEPPIVRESTSHAVSGSTTGPSSGGFITHRLHAAKLWFLATSYPSKRLAFVGSKGQWLYSDGPGEEVGLAFGCVVNAAERPTTIVNRRILSTQGFVARHASNPYNASGIMVMVDAGPEVVIPEPGVVSSEQFGLFAIDDRAIRPEGVGSLEVVESPDVVIALPAESWSEDSSLSRGLVFYCIAEADMPLWTAPGDEEPAAVFPHPPHPGSTQNPSPGSDPGPSNPSSPQRSDSPFESKELVRRVSFVMPSPVLDEKGRPTK